MKAVALAVVFFCYVVSSLAASPLPVVMWHGMGDSCCNPQSMGRIQAVIEGNIPGVYVKSIMLGSDQDEDVTDGFIGVVNDQIASVCSMLAADPKLRGGFNAIGFSQGGQFIRAYVERCNNPPVRNLITVGGQHQGVYGFPNCPGVNVTVCEWIRELLDLGAYNSWIQNFLVQAQYWQDPLDDAGYLSGNIFLPDINNALPTKNQTYKNNILKLSNFVMVKFTEDTMVQPIESEWFGFYAPGQDQTVLPLRQTPLYTEDWLGLKQLDQQGKLAFYTVVGEHLQFSMQWFNETIIPYFKN